MPSTPLSPLMSPVQGGAAQVTLSVPDPEAEVGDPMRMYHVLPAVTVHVAVLPVPHALSLQAVTAVPDGQDAPG